MVEEQPVMGLDIVGCSGCSGESSSMSSPVPLPAMAEICPVRTGQCAFRHGCCQLLIGYMVPSGSFAQQQSSSSESGRSGTSRGLSTSDSSQGGESGLSGGVA